MRTIKKIIFILFLIMSFIYLFIIISPKVFKNHYPFGIKVAVILTGSMEPTLKINDFVIIKKPNNIKVNDIISYKNDTSEKEIIHRVIKIDNNKVITKGDANNTEDMPIDKKNVTGIYVSKIKYLGQIISFIKKPIIFSTIITIIITIMIKHNKK